MESQKNLVKNNKRRHVAHSVIPHNGKSGSRKVRGINSTQVGQWIN